ncbi:hypothetical protein [Nonomuraea sp. LPB2021202275-12-8]|uniref:hypothetical protein n=1 Tax=Nonomuraea sp. LPB2021202275-12-8 TaxID=3120159 RepID=UPI00300C1886
MNVETSIVPDEAEEKTAPESESEWEWQAPAFLRIPLRIAAWLVVRGVRYWQELSPAYAGVLLAVVAGQRWAWWALLMVGIALIAITVLVARVADTRPAWLAYLIAAEVPAVLWTTTASANTFVPAATWISWLVLTGAATGGRWLLVRWLAKQQPELPAAEERPALLPAPERHPLQETIDDIASRLTQARDRIGLPELDVVDSEIVTDNRFTLTVLTRRPAVEVDQLRATISAKIGLRVGMLRQVTPVLDNAGVSVWHFQVGELHGGQNFWWKAPIMPRSILEPIGVGLQEDEEPASMVLATQDGGSRHGATSGKTGYGKTVHNIVLGAGVGNTFDAIPLVCDLKGLFDFAPLAPLTPIYAWTPEQATRLLVALASLCTEGPANRAFLKQRGERVIVPGADRKAIVLFIDEHRMVFNPAMNPHYKEASAAAHTIALLGRAYGVGLYISGQDMSETAMPQSNTDSGTAFRRQLHHRRVFHDDTKASGQFLLDDYARLDVTQLKRPGRFFHADGDAPTLPILGPDADPETVGAWAAERSRDADGFDERTWALLADQLGDLLLPKMRGIPAELAEYLPSRTPARFSVRPDLVAPAGPVPPSPEVARMDELARLEQDLAELLGGEPAAAVPPEAGMPATHVAVPLADPALEGLAAGLEAGGSAGSSRADLDRASGMRRSWVGARLTALAEAQAVYSTGQGRGVRWHLAEGLDGARLRSMIAAVEQLLRPGGGDAS